MPHVKKKAANVKSGVISPAFLTEVIQESNKNPKRGRYNIRVKEINGGFVK